MFGATISISSAPRTRIFCSSESPPLAIFHVVIPVGVTAHNLPSISRNRITSPSTTSAAISCKLLSMIPTRADSFSWSTNAINFGVPTGAEMFCRSVARPRIVSSESRMISLLRVATRPTAVPTTRPQTSVPARKRSPVSRRMTPPRPLTYKSPSTTERLSGRIPSAFSLMVSTTMSALGFVRSIRTTAVRSKTAIRSP